MARYFYTEFAESPVVVGGKTYKFDRCAFTAGHWIGVYAGDDGDMGLLRVRGVSEINAEDYGKLQAQKKTTTSFSNLSSLSNSPRAVVQSSGHPAMQIQGKGAVASAGEPKPEPGEEAVKVISSDEINKIAPVASPSPLQGPTGRRKGRK